MLNGIKKLFKSNNETGHVLIVALMVLALGTLIIFPMVSLMVTGLQAGQTVEEKTDIFYAADSGIEYALYYMLNNIELLPDADNISVIVPFNTNVNGVSVEVTVEYVTSNIYNIIAEASDAETGTSLTKINSYVSAKGNGNGNPAAIFQDAVTTLGGGITASGAALISGSIFSNSYINLSGSAGIAGDVYAESNIGMGWSTYISGDAYAKGAIERPQNVEGSANAGAADQNPEPLEQDMVNSIISDTLETTDFTPLSAGAVTRSGNWALKYWPVPDSVYPDAEHISGNLTINTGTSITFSDSVHVDGDLVINCSGCTITFNGPVVVEGDINIQNGTVIFNDSVYSGDATSLSGSGVASFNGDVKVESNLNLGSGGDVDFGGTIYVGGEFNISGDRKVNVSDDIYVGEDLTLSGSSRIVGGQTVVVMGDVALTGGTKLDADDLPFLLVPTGDVSLTGSSYISAVVYAPLADISYNGSVTLYGAIACNSLSLSGSAKVEYAEGVTGNPNIPGNGGSSSIDKFSVLSWDVD
jgi:hypothetical protein